VKNSALSPRGVMTRTERLPLGLQEIDAAWLTRFLAPRYPGAVVEAMDLLQHIPGHTTKLRVRVTLNQAGKDAGLPDQMCLKGNWTGDPRSSQVCVTEARFYGDLPEFLNVPSPKCLMADWDDDDDPAGIQGIIVLEDLIPMGGEFSPTAAAMPVEDVRKAIVGLAALHGTSWGKPELEEMQWLPTSVAEETPVDDYWMLLLDIISVRKLDEHWISILPPWLREDPDRLYACFQELCAQERADPGPHCLIHGDAHPGNSYRLPDGNRLWFDWQLPRRGRCWRDYSYFVIGALNVADRRAHEGDLLDFYLAQLAEHGVTLDREQAWIDYRRWIVWGLIAWITNLNPNEPSEPVLDRFSRAAEDLDLRALYSV